MRQTRPLPPERSTVSLLLGRRRRSRGRVGRLDVVPAERLLVIQRDGGVASRRRFPRARRLDEEVPVRLVGRRALAELRGFVIDLAGKLPEAEGLGLSLATRLIQLGLSVDRVGGEAHAPLER